MNEKPHRLDMSFGEALARLTHVPKSAVVKDGEIIKHTKPQQPKASPGATTPKTGAD